MDIANLPPKGLTRAEALGKIFDLESSMLKQENPLFKDDDDFEYVHWFAPGLYGREIHIPTGVVLTTMIHGTEHIAILSKGKMTIYSDQGLDVIEAPHTMITTIGTKRALYTHSDCVFTTVHLNPTNERDVPTLIKKLTFESEEAYQKTLEVLP